MYAGRVLHRPPLAAIACAALLASTARADAPEELAPSQRTMTWRASPDGEAPSAPAAPEQRRYAEERPFVHLLDPTTPARGQVGVDYAVGAASGVAADRPLPSVVVAAGLVHSLGLVVGATDRIAPFVVGRVAQDPGAEGLDSWSGAAGVRWQVTRLGAPLRLALAGAAMRDPSGSAGAWVRVAGSWDVGRLRLASNAHAERVFASGRDDVDLVLMAGASWRTLDVMRVGVEYVGQDLEDAFEDDVEGGARHYAGPTVALDLFGGRAQLVGGPAFGLNRETSGLLGRVAMVVGF